MLIKALVYIAAYAASLVAISNYFPEMIQVESLYTALIVAVIWGLIGFTVRPVLSILTLPINIITFGLFSFVLNALIFWFLATFISGFHVYGFIAALVGSFLLTLVAWVLHSIL